MAQVKIVWDPLAKTSFKKYLSRIKKDSLQGAEKVRSDILKIVGGLLEHPEKFPPDKFKKDNDGDHRAFEKHSFRIVYLVTENQIRILRVRHVKQEPKSY